MITHQKLLCFFGKHILSGSPCHIVISWSIIIREIPFVTTSLRQICKLTSICTPSRPSAQQLCQGNLLMPWANCWVVLWWIPWEEQTLCWLSFCSSTFFWIGNVSAMPHEGWRVSLCCFLLSDSLVTSLAIFSRLVFQSQHLFCSHFLCTKKVHHFQPFPNFHRFCRLFFCWVSSSLSYLLGCPSKLVKG